ncbi:MAG TPA: beta-ketoacyl-ACP synthase 3 [Acidimicrobiales bacterium]|nr:beta-ketoacyl-ACP synthase 3 [Acidimicrobiales bacterium]
MTSTDAPKARILGLGVYRPRRSVSNDELCEAVESSDEWIRERTGIQRRRWAEADETLEMMAEAAGRAAVAASGLDAASLDMVILASCSSVQPFWPTASRVAGALGLEVPAFDLNATCAGFCYSLGLARDLIGAGTVGTVLVIGAERLTDMLDPTDRGTAFLFADGAGAFVVGAGSVEGIGPVVWGTQGTKGDALVLAPTWAEYRQDPGVGAPSVSMQGRRVFRWAVEEMPKVALAAVEAVGLTLKDVQIFIPHQANLRITQAIVRALDLPESVVVAEDIVDSGNTSSASIPLALDRALTDGLVHSGDAALLLGFGGGLSFGAQVITIP